LVSKKPSIKLYKEKGYYKHKKKKSLILIPNVFLVVDIQQAQLQHLKWLA
jgi:hypothetical protein